MNHIEPQKTALVLMDLQNDIVSPEGKFGGDTARYIAENGVLERATRLLEAARASGMLVIHVGVTYRPGHPECPDHIPVLAAVKSSGALVEGSWGAEFHSAVAPSEGESIVTKRGLSSFAGSDLELLLAVRGADTLLLSGVATNLVVESTARDAAERALRPVVVADCCAGMSPELHDAACQVMPMFAAVVTLDQTLAALGAVGSGAEA